MKQLTGPFVSELIVKKSRFIASACNVATVADAKSFIDLVREPDASHNCWAYRINASQFRYSDDGEPSGTAGKPIFGAISSSGLEHVVVVITRYFGGVKLGAGGLIRAYNSAAAQCLLAAPKIVRERTVDIDVCVRWAGIGPVQVIAQRFERLETVYDETGCTISMRIPQRDAEEVQQEIIDACAGAVRIKNITGN